MTNQQGAPEALRLANSITWMDAFTDFQRDELDKAAAELRRQHARIAELEAQLEAIGAGGVSGPLVGQPQAMPDLSALTERGAKAWAGVDARELREGAASAGSEPVARVNDDGFIVEIGDLLLSPGQKLYLHPSPPEGMVGGWMPIETAPVAGLILLTVEDSAGERRVFPAEASHENGGWVWQVTLGWLGWTRLNSGWKPILWRHLPPPPTTSAGSGKGD